MGNFIVLFRCECLASSQIWTFRPHYSPQQRIQTTYMSVILGKWLHGDLAALNFIDCSNNSAMIQPQHSPVCVCVTPCNNHYGLSVFFLVKVKLTLFRACYYPQIPTSGSPWLGQFVLHRAASQTGGTEQKTGSRLPLRGQCVNRDEAAEMTLVLYRFPFYFALGFLSLRANCSF